MKLMNALLLIIGLAPCLNAQIKEDFTDGFKSKASWHGALDKFILNDGFLQSNSDSSHDKFSIWTSTDSLLPFEFRLELKLGFNTSSANLIRFTLASETDSILMVIGSTQDDIKIFYMAQEAELLYDSKDKITEKCHLKIRLSQDEKGIMYFDWMELKQTASDAAKWKSKTIRPQLLRYEVWQSTSSFHKKHQLHHIQFTAVEPDLEPPVLTTFEPIDSQIFRLAFNEAVDSKQLQLSIDRLAMHALTDSGLLYKSPYLEEAEYSIRVQASDSSQNLLDSSFQHYLYYPRTPLPSEIILNELLFDPYPNDYDFIELYNPGERAIDISSYQVCSYLSEEWKCSEKLSNKTYLLKAKQYLFLSENPLAVCTRYPCPESVDSLRIKLAAMNNDQGTLSLRRQGFEVDHFKYSMSFHSEILRDSEGVSLEKINPIAVNNSNNWHSAASTEAFASPGRRNSNFLQLDHEEEFTLEHSWISPNGDAFQDLLIVSYALAEAGTLVSLFVFDLEGRLKAIPIDSELIGTQGLLKWDLKLPDLGILNPGAYILYLEAFGPKGRLHQKKFAFSVASH